MEFCNKGLFINDVTQNWPLLDPPPPPMSSNVIFWLTPLTPPWVMSFMNKIINQNIYIKEVLKHFDRHNPHLKGGGGGANPT